MKRLLGRGPTGPSDLDLRRGRGGAAIRAHDWLTAEAEYGALTRLGPETPSHWVGWGQALAELKLYDQAAAAFRQVLRLEPDNAYARQALADLQTVSDSAGVDPEGGGLLTPLADLDPMSVEARRYRANAALRSGDAATAEFEFGWLLEDHPDLGANWRGWGQALLGAGRGQEGAVALHEALRLDPADVEALVALSDLERRRGREDRADALDQQAFTLAGSVGASTRQRLVALQRAAERAKRRRDWQAVAEAELKLVELQPREPSHRDGAITAMVRMGDHRRASEYAYADARRTGQWGAVHALTETLREVGRTRHARALAHLLAAAWPHSAYHQRLYARMLAAHAGLGAGDSAFRRGIERAGSSPEMERAYYEVALAAHDARAADARLTRFVANHPTDLEAQVAHGYVLANTVGIDAAERRFERLALDWMLDAAPLRALAHMAMRRRDRREALRRWRRFGEVYPADVQAAVETARALFELGEADEALAACRRWIGSNRPSRDMEQFYAGLLAATGAFEAAETRALECLRAFGPAWIALDALIIARGNLGRLIGSEDEIVGHTPAVLSHDDLKRFYQAVRLLEYFGAAGELLRAVLPTVPAEHDLAWAYPYLHHGEHGLAEDPRPAAGAEERAAEARAAKDHRRLKRAIGTTTLDRWPEVTAAEVDAVVARAAAAKPTVHIFNMFEQPNGGSELHALDLGQRLSAYADVQFWAPENPHPAVRAEYGATGIGQDARGHPQGGVLVFVGVYYDLGPWLAQVKPRRVLALYNTFDAVKLSAFARAIHRYTGVKLELLFCSEMMKDEVRLPGLFEPSPTDLVEFSPVKREALADRFVIGRHSRDVVEKHDPDDGRVYQALVGQGSEVRLLGATCMRSIFPSHPGIQLLPAQRGGMAEYLGGLDCFYYRTGTWIEPWGRVVIEAMAMGLPVVVHERGGYAEAVNNGVDGFVFSTGDEAIEQLSRLKDDVELRARIGAAARAKAEALLGPEALKRLLAYYLV